MEIKRDAKFSEDRKYRYVLDREWDESGKLVTFIMLNPSIANEIINDQTIKRCLAFAKKWNCGRLKVVNLFAWRATDPNELTKVDDPVGPDNDTRILEAIKQADMVVCAWGNNVTKVSSGKDRGQKVRGMIRAQATTPYYLGSLTKKDNPPHPLRLATNTELVPWIN